MKTYSYIAIFAAAALAVCGCQNNLEIDAPGSGISFNPTVGGIGTTQTTKASDLCSADGSVAIPLWLKVSDGISVGEIAGQARNDAAACNDGNRHAELDSASDPASAPAIPATKGELLNPDPNPGGTGTKPDKPLSNYATEIGGTFYVSGWKGSTPARFIPSSGSSTYEAVTYSNSKWSTITTDWDSTTDATFYAYANLPSSGATVSNGDAASQVLTYSAVPPAASAQKDILMGFYTGNGTPNTTDKTCTAPIVFHHPLTAVKFVKGDFEGYTSIKFKAIYLSQIYKSGTATMTPTSIAATDPGDRFSWTSLSTEMQEASQESTTDLLNTTTNVIGEPFIIIPQNLADKPVTITVVVELDGVVNALTTTCDSGSWKAGYTNTYSLSREGYEWEYTFTIDGGDSYKYSFSNNFDVNKSCTLENISSIRTRSDDSSITENVAWTIQSYKIGDSEPVVVNANSFSASPCWFGASHPSSNPQYNKIELNGLSCVYSYRNTNEYWTGNNGEWSPADWSDEGVIDLSKMDYRKDDPSKAINVHGMTTANCYVIRHAGTYKFPLVYGNAMKNGSPYTKAYNPGITGDSNCWSSFKNHLDADITSPFIEANSGCRVVGDPEILWQTDGPVVTNVTLSPASPSTPVTSSNVRYIQFEVPQSSIQQSNALIAVRDNSGNIIWSWHIWVTNDPDATKTKEVTNYDDIKYTFFAMDNVGKVTGKVYDPRDDVLVTLKQTGSDKTVTLTVHQVIPHTLKSFMYYQWGRKDPFPDSEKDWQGSEVITKVPASSLSDVKTVGYAIQHPTEFRGRYSDSAGSSWANPTPYNAWSGSVSGVDLDANGINTTKTIYDPSPVFFMVPTIGAFSGFADERLKQYYTSDPGNGKPHMNSPSTDYYKGYSFYTSLREIVTESGTAKAKNTGGPEIWFSQNGIWYASASGGDALRGWYYTSSVTSEPKSRMFAFQETEFNNVCNASLANGHSVRPILE